MMVSIVFLAGARFDFDEAWTWYANESELAAERFSESIDNALKRIAQNATVFRFLDAKHQDCPLKRFPFRIVFRDLGDRIVVVAIAHAKRRPGYWRRRR